MRSCASRGARAPGSARNNSRWSRSLRNVLAPDIAGASRRSAPMWSVHSRCRDAFGRKDGSRTGIGGRGLGAEIGPGLEILERVDDTAADLSVFRAGTIGAVLFEGAAGQAKEAGRLRSTQKAWRQAGQWIGHDRSSVVLRPAAGYRR